MEDTIRDSACGQLVRFFTRETFFRYPEEASDFKCPCGYDVDSSSGEADDAPETAGDLSGSITASSKALKEENDAIVPNLEKTETARTANLGYHDRILSRDLEAALQRTTSRAIAPKKTADGKILVDWFTTGMLYSLFDG